MNISIIVPTRQGISQAFLNSLNNQIITKVYPTEIIEVTGNHLTIQRNEAIKQAIGDFIIFIDDDIELGYLYLDEIISTFKKYPDAIAVTGNVKVKMYKTNPIFTFLYEIYARIFRILHYGRGRYFLSGFSENYHPKIKEVIRGEMLYGCNMAFRKEVFNNFRFDEDIEAGMYGEDDFFAYPLSRKYPIYYNPFAICYDNRTYPKGKQKEKIRFTFRNLVRRHRKRKFNLITEIAFWWSMFGFTIFKIVEAIYMRDMSIIKGILTCYKKYNGQSIEEIRKEIKVRKVYV